MEAKEHLYIESNSRLIPKEELRRAVDEYLRYCQEKDNSDSYRLIFTINPVCSNVLFNSITEIVKDEGSITPIVLHENVGTSLSIAYFDNLKGIENVKRSDAIQDTALSHEDIGNFTYHCGVDIFNNHLFRQKVFANVSKIQENDQPIPVFNTIKDYLRDKDGNSIECVPLRETDGHSINREPVNKHLYSTDTLKTFDESINSNLIETDGWMGFYNPTVMSIENYFNGEKGISLNKGINNRFENEMIDMYPGRDMYSFVPKYNKYKNRLEKNWDYCLTYPALSDTQHESVCDANSGAKGLLCEIQGDKVFANFIDKFGGLEGLFLNLKSKIKHGLRKGDTLNLTFYSGSTKYEMPTPVEVTAVGSYGNDKDFYFSVKTDYVVYGMLSLLGEEIEDVNTKSVAERLDNAKISIRFRKRLNGIPCEYYLRQFKKIKNLDNGKDLMSSSMKLGFGTNIYSDDAVQILFNDDVKIGGLTDNLGRPLSEIFLTIIKRNAGHIEWYENGVYGSDSVEFSHCFGRISSGLDMPKDMYDYNVRMLHNIEKDNRLGILENVIFSGRTSAPSALENDISIDDDVFYGDIVEFSPSTYTERIIGDVYHRFNTAQRETLNEDFKNLFYDEIVYDDFEVSNDNDDEIPDFKVETKAYNESGDDFYPANIFPEGYYYKPHYRIVLREFEGRLRQGSHTQVKYSNGEVYGTNIRITAVTNYYLEIGKPIYFYDKNSNEYIEGSIISVSGDDFSDITLRCEGITNLDNYFIFKKNVDMPKGAYELKDGTGRYLYRNMISSQNLTSENETYSMPFTNGAHYITSNINFYLKRQLYNSYEYLNGAPRHAISLTIENETKDINNAQYIKEGRGEIC